MRLFARREKRVPRTWLTSVVVRKVPERETSSSPTRSTDRSCSSWRACARQKERCFFERGMRQRRPSAKEKLQSGNSPGGSLAARRELFFAACFPVRFIVNLARALAIGYQDAALGVWRLHP